MKKLMYAVFAVMMIMFIAMPDIYVYADSDNSEKVYDISSINKVNESLDERIEFEYTFVNDQEKVVYSFRTLFGENPEVSYSIEDKGLSRKEAHQEYEQIKEDFEEILKDDNDERVFASTVLMALPILIALLFIFSI